MNTGVCDAHNLAWKLAAVLQGRAGPRLLDSYTGASSPPRWAGVFLLSGAHSCTMMSILRAVSGCQPHCGWLAHAAAASSALPCQQPPCPSRFTHPGWRRCPPHPPALPPVERKPVGLANCQLSVDNFNEALRVPQVGSRWWQVGGRWWQLLRWRYGGREAG